MATAIERGIERELITGLILAGGQGKRMGGVDKGLVTFDGKPLAQHALDRLNPQVGRTMISANRHLDVYQGLGVPVWADETGQGSYQGPLAGMLAGLRHCETPWLVVVPCDCPRLPLDLVQRLMHPLLRQDAAVAATTENGVVTWQPVFCAVNTRVLPHLENFLLRGDRAAKQFIAELRHAVVVFEASSAFLNMNEPQQPPA